MEILQNLSSMTGWPGLIFMILFIVTGSIYIRRTTKSQADEIAKKANTEAIESLKAALEAVELKAKVLQDRVKYLEELLEKAGIKH